MILKIVVLNGLRLLHNLYCSAEQPAPPAEGLQVADAQDECVETYSFGDDVQWVEEGIRDTLLWLHGLLARPAWSS